MKNIKNPDRNSWAELLKRPTNTYEDIEQTVASIFKEIHHTAKVKLKQ